MELARASRRLTQVTRRKDVQLFIDQVAEKGREGVLDEVCLCV
jgi:hypothetical protein